MSFFSVNKQCSYFYEIKIDTFYKIQKKKIQKNNSIDYDKLKKKQSVLIYNARKI